MEILASSTDWTPNDEEQLAKFLSSETGRRLIPKLAENIPPLLEAGETNAILIRSGVVLAHQKAIETLFLLAHPPAPVQNPVREYPPLEDDKAWRDGQTLESSSSPNPKPQT